MELLRARFFTLAAGVCVGLAAVIFTPHSAVQASDEEALLVDITPSGPLNTEINLTESYGWQFEPNETDTEISSVTIWQNGSPNTSSVTVYTNNNDTLGTPLDTFTYEPSSSDTTPVATYNGKDFYAFTYRGDAILKGENNYWLVITPGTTPTNLVGVTNTNLQYAPDTVGRVVETGNNFYRLSSGNPQYFNSLVSYIYVLRQPVNAPDRGGAGAAPAVVRTVSFTLPEGVTCSMSGNGANVGLWMQLPAANECSLASGSGNGNAPQLLGWANAPDFPMSIAQRQIDNGWGAYEMTNTDGQVTTVFIPAGGSAQITGDARFFPVFAD